MADRTTSQQQEESKKGAGILIRTIKEGSGKPPKKGDICEVHYEGFLEDGRQFDSSRERNQSLQLRLGEGHVMEGWEVALLHMKVGQLAEVTIPHLYGYGEQGYPPKIPPRSTLVYQLEIIRIEGRK